MALTALQLVNRILRLERLGDVGTFADDRAKVTLDLLNEATREVLEEHVFDFDRRGDGVLTTSEVIRGGSDTGGATPKLTITALFGHHIIFGTDSEAADFFATFLLSRISYLVPEDDSKYSNTAFRIESATYAGSDAVFLNLNIDSWPGDILAESTNFRVFTPEFILPDTVRKITSVKHEEQDLRLSQITHGTSFQQVVPRLSENFSQPGIAAVGGYDTAGYIDRGVVPDPGLRVLIWPIEEDPMVLHYQYVYRHPELVEPTDELAGVPLHIVDNIIDLAFSKAVSTIDKDIESGRGLRQDANSSRRRKQNADNPSPLRRFSMASMDQMSSSSRREDTRNLPSPFVDPSTGT